MQLDSSQLTQNIVSTKVSVFVSTDVRMHFKPAWTKLKNSLADS